MKTIVAVLLVVWLISCQETPQKNNYPNILNEFLKDSKNSILPDYSFAGYHYGESNIPEVTATQFNVTEYGAIANDGLDDTEAIQATVDAAGQAGGGIVFFPQGTFHVNMDSTQLDIIKINYSHIVMRGSGSGENGTIIYSGSQTTQPEEQSPWLSPFVFHTGLNLFGTDYFFSIDELPNHIKLIANLKKGDSTLKLENTKGIKAGDVLLLAMSNTADDGDLMKELMNPIEYDPFQTSYINAGKDRKSSFQWPVEIKEVLNDNEVVLKQPARRDILTKFEARVAQMPMLKEIGIENFRFECAYKGGYKHHLTREHDYGWGAICMHRVSHGWVRNININNYVQNTHLVNSRNVTISNISMNGLDGHYGPKMYHSSDNLVQDIEVNAKYTHGPGLEGASFGNVYRNIKLAHFSPADLHGIGGADFCPPMYNLYENISNLSHIAGGGAPANIPHAGEYNTFWGLQFKSFKDEDFNELFYSWIWRDAQRFGNDFHIDCHKQYLRSILVGVHNTEKTLSVEHSTKDRADDWIYIEGLNNNLELPSLYEIQLKNRLNN
ncbi:glycosyl hydrolase family 28-related protein [Labilibacter marinus]|uniref:glycosyl hydrolase family 28-related protein n=1 Tax=Labilibacter marinus TaxID=1477105 RepID=UPI000835ABA7|nr:glycosyl hydrolase family 28-related protein [Labilibacter marinus]